MYSSRIPPPDEWAQVEKGHLRGFRCTHHGLPRQLFCGKAAVLATEDGPRCEEHLKPDYEREPS